jgi:regulator of sigma D
MKTQSIITSQLPEHLQKNAPAFVAFVNAYYGYVDNITEGHGQLQNAKYNSDVDLCSEANLNSFYDMYAQNLPRDVAMDRRNFIKILHAIHESSGTEDALKIAFRAIFNEPIKVSYPGEFSLKSSDGVWVKENYISLETRFGEITEDVVQIIFKNDFGDYSFETTRTETIGPVVRLYFQAYTKLNFDLNQRVLHYGNDGQLKYAGDLIKSPAKLRVVVPGRDWQLGQILIVPGSNKNTIAKVTSINETGGITGIEVVEYGSEHPENQLFTISPYPNKPSSSSIFVDSILISTNPDVYSHTVNITDFNDSLSETATGISNALTQNSFADGNYFLQDYVGHNVFAQQVSVVSANNVANFDSGDLTIQQWLQSRATLVYEYGNIVSLPGYYLSDRGHISNNTIRLQDNYFYQAFSYLIETSQDITKYQTLLNITHPAGSKQFSDLTKTIVADLPISSEYIIAPIALYSYDKLETLPITEDILNTLVNFYDT